MCLLLTEAVVRPDLCATARLTWCPVIGATHFFSPFRVSVIVPDCYFARLVGLCNTIPRKPDVLDAPSCRTRAFCAPSPVAIPGWGTVTRVVGIYSITRI